MPTPDGPDRSMDVSPAGTVVPAEQYLPPDISRVNRVDFSRRNRKLEWRARWFHLNRTRDEKELIELRDRALRHKDALIKEHAPHARHRAAYAPAGPGTPWFCIGPRNINGRVKCIAVHPTDENTAYAGAASGGVWKTIDGGQSWRPLWDQEASLAIGAIAIAPSNPDRVYAGTGEGVIAGTYGAGHNFPGAGVYVSSDAGATWVLRDGLANRRITRVLVSETHHNRVFVAGQSGFERSINGGATWTMLRAGQISDAAIDPNNPDILYICVHNDGIYKSTDGGDTFTLLANGPTGVSATWVKIAIGRNGTNGSNFLVCKSLGNVRTTSDGGATWTAIPGSHGSGWVGWCDLIAVSPADEDLIFAGGVGLERTPDGGASWAAVAGLHADQHVAVFAPSNPNVVFETNDGGVYRSTNAGGTFAKASHGMVVSQFYDVGSWENISTVVGGGMQDQGTNMSTGGLTWRPIHGADGMYFVVHPTNPRIIYAESQGTELVKSTDGGNSWSNVTFGLVGSGPWVGVITMDMASPDRLFTGTTSIHRTLDGCATAWVQVSQDLGNFVSAIAIAPSDPNRIYAGTGDTYERTGQGRVFVSTDGGATSPWPERTGTLPSARPVLDIAIDRTNADRALVCFGGSNPGAGANAVFITTNGGTSWTDISSSLPNVSMNAVVFDPNSANTFYVGTDVGVFRTTDGGASWHAFDNGIPNVVIADMHVDVEDNMLYAATFGRGMYRVGIAPAAVVPAVDLYLRDSLLDVGVRVPSPSGLPNPNDVSDTVHWWESPDIKVDVSPFYAPDALFDGVEFDEDLLHEDPKRTETNRFYLQVHNRGWQPTTNVRVRAFFSDASAGLPSLPNALTPPDFNLTSTVDWQPIGPAQTIATLEPNRPVIVSWDWTVPVSAATHSCLLAVVSSGDDPITTPETNVDVLIASEKRVCLKNLHVVNSSGPRPAPSLLPIKFHNAKTAAGTLDIIVSPNEFAEGAIGLLLEPVAFDDPGAALHGVQRYLLRPGEDIGRWYVRPDERREVDAGAILEKLDRSVVYEFDPTKPSEIRGIRVGPKQTIQGLITCLGHGKVAYGRTQRFSIMQRQDGGIVGGSTYEVRLRRAKGLHPVSRIRVVLDTIEILDDREPWFKGRGEFVFVASVGFNGEPGRTHRVRLPESGVFELSDKPGGNRISPKQIVFDGYVAEKDNLTVTLAAIEKDTFDPDDALTLYRRTFSYPPETWVGTYGPDGAAQDPESMSDWKVTYRIQSLKL